MAFHRPDADKQFLGDLAVGKPPNNVFHHFQLARSQRFDGLLPDIRLLGDIFNQQPGYRRMDVQIALGDVPDGVGQITRRAARQIQDEYNDWGQQIEKIYQYMRNPGGDR